MYIEVIILQIEVLLQCRILTSFAWKLATSFKASATTNSPLSSILFEQPHDIFGFLIN